MPPTPLAPFADRLRHELSGLSATERSMLRRPVNGMTSIEVLTELCGEAASVRRALFAVLLEEALHQMPASTRQQLAPAHLSRPSVEALQELWLDAWPEDEL